MSSNFQGGHSGHGRGTGRSTGRDVGRGSDRGPGRRSGRDVGRDSDRSTGRGAGRDISRGTDRGPGRGPGRDIGRGAGRNIGRDNTGRGPGRDVGRGTDRGTGRGISGSGQPSGRPQGTGGGKGMERGRSESFSGSGSARPRHGGFRQSERRGPEGVRQGGGSKKLFLKGEKRAKRRLLLRELGRTTERKEGLRTPHKEELIRLNRFIANAGVCSRREADKFIAAGVVTVNGQVVSELGSKVSPTDEVRFDNRLLTPERKVYLLLNKPRDVVTTTDDPHAERTVLDIVKGACQERIYPVGRLDKNSTGLILLTNDGDLSKKLTHPSHKVEKVYQVTLDKSVSVGDMQKIAAGIELDDGFIAADAIAFVEGKEKDTVGIEIHSGRNRIVRRMFESLGYKVRALDRVSFAGLTKKNLPRGKWRLLAPREVAFLKMK